MLSHWSPFQINPIEAHERNVSSLILLVVLNFIVVLNFNFGTNNFKFIFKNQSNLNPALKCSTFNMCGSILKVDHHILMENII